MVSGLKMFHMCRIGLLLVISASVPACAKFRDSSFTPERAGQVRTGRTIKEVEAILGQGEEIQQSQVPALSSPGLAPKWLRWVDGENRVYVGFKGGRVVTISSLFEG